MSVPGNASSKDRHMRVCGTMNISALGLIFHSFNEGGVALRLEPSMNNDCGDKRRTCSCSETQVEEVWTGGKKKKYTKLMMERKP